MDEATAYQWALQAIQPVIGQAEQHRLEQAVDKIASAILQADKDARAEVQARIAELEGYIDAHNERVLKQSINNQFLFDNLQ